MSIQTLTQALNNLGFATTAANERVTISDPEHTPFVLTAEVTTAADTITDWGLTGDIATGNQTMTVRSCFNPGTAVLASDGTAQSALLATVAEVHARFHRHI